MLADIDHLHHVSVHAGLADGAPESRLMHPRRAGGDHHPRQPLLLNSVDDGALPRVGTGVLEGLGMQHVAHGERRLGHLVRGHGAGDIGATLADEDADTHGSATRSRLAGGWPGLLPARTGLLPVWAGLLLARTGWLPPDRRRPCRFWLTASGR